MQDYKDHNVLLCDILFSKKKIHIRAYTHLTENKKKVQTAFYQTPIHTFTGIQNITIGNI